MNKIYIICFLNIQDLSLSLTLPLSLWYPLQDICSLINLCMPSALSLVAFYLLSTFVKCAFDLAATAAAEFCVSN